MGRRGRGRNSDPDRRLQDDDELQVESLEERYDRERQKRQYPTLNFEQGEEDGDNQPSHPPTAKKQKQKQQGTTATETSTSESKVEALRLKKIQRKQRAQEKKMQKAKELQNIQKSQESLIQTKQKLKEQQRKEKEASHQHHDQASFQTVRKGVQYRDVLVGKGQPIQDRKKVRVAYTLRAKHRCGKILDSSENFGFRVGRGDVIEGWDIGLQGMRQGGKRFLLIPPQAGYGQQNIGAGPGGMLFFEVTLLSC